MRVMIFAFFLIPWNLLGGAETGGAGFSHTVPGAEVPFSCKQETLQLRQGPANILSQFLPNLCEVYINLTLRDEEKEAIEPVEEPEK